MLKSQEIPQSDKSIKEIKKRLKDVFMEKYNNNMDYLGKALSNIFSKEKQK